MITSIGVDVVPIQKVAGLWREHETEARERLFTARELNHLRKAESSGGSGPKRGSAAESYLATRFAAKEATIKVLQLDQELQYELSDIEVIGRVSVRVKLTGALLELARSRKIGKITGSVSLLKDSAVAVLVGETDDDQHHD